jgi:hypothetical protein
MKAFVDQPPRPITHTPCVLQLLRRFQSQLPGQAKYSSVLPSLLTIAREEGLRSLYKGFVPKALRLGIGQSVGLVMFEQVGASSLSAACSVML